jgi:aminobenzoyl-glutamate utilization protein B
MNIREAAVQSYQNHERELIRMSKSIWDNPEIGAEERYASKLISDRLGQAGFRIETGIGGIATAFVGSWGTGRPILGILGEYDALPGFSQKVSSRQEPEREGGPGHACGHNLLGVGCLGAILALKEVMEENKIGGTIRYYGCPAEETLVGKVFMAKHGAFDDLDAAITWHAGYPNTVLESANLALNSFKLNFHGISCHASNLGRGRSALDAVVMTDVGINCMRDNVIPEARIHGVITHGGLQPNIIPSFAQSWYYVRAPSRQDVEEIYGRILELAKGAALMTGTKFELELLAGCYNYLSNDVITYCMKKNLQQIGGIGFTEDDRRFAQEIQSSVPPGVIEETAKNFGMDQDEFGGVLSDRMVDGVGGFAKGDLRYNSTDVGDVSYTAPTGLFTTCCMPFGVALHTWQCVASSGSSIGFKGMALAAKTLALSGLDLLLEPNTVSAAHDEFRKKKAGRKYVSPLHRSMIF